MVEDMKSVVKQVIGEAASRNEVKPVVVKTRQVEYHVCPHCDQEIFEKHTFIDGDFMGEHVERHSDCGGAIKFPPVDVSPAWKSLLSKTLKL